VIFRRPRVKAYWWIGNPAAPVRNFGDGMAPLLLERFAGVPCEWDTVSRSCVVTTGSVLEHIPPLWEGFVLGAGKLWEDSRLHLRGGPAEVLAVRGPLSAKSVPGDFALGDPGLLADALVPVQSRTTGLGIVPHWSDAALARDPRFYSDRWTTEVIDVRGDPLKVIAAIGRCEKIVTSSLHGLITADAFTIPRRLEPGGRLAAEGGYFKFRDYSASIQAPFEPGALYRANRVYVEDRRFELMDAYERLGELLRSR